LPFRTYLADNKTIVAVFRNHAPAGTLCITRSTDEGHSWTPAKSLGSGDPSAMGGPASVEPKMALLDNGAVVISTGRVGLFLWISLTNGESWMPFNLVSCHDVAGIWVAFFQECQQSRCGQALFHNSRMPPLDQYSAAFVRGAGDSVESTSYTSMVHLGGNDVLVCYDRLGAPRRVF